MKKIKSYNFWVSLAGAVGVLAVQIAKVFGVKIEASGVEEIIMSICGVLVVFGIVKKPKQNGQTNDTNE